MGDKIKNNFRGSKKKGGERGVKKNKVGDLKNKGPVYFDNISCTFAEQLCTCAAQHYMCN